MTVGSQCPRLGDRSAGTSGGRGGAGASAHVRSALGTEVREVCTKMTKQIRRQMKMAAQTAAFCSAAAVVFGCSAAASDDPNNPIGSVTLASFRQPQTPLSG